ncbi:MAG: DUF3107 family protein [Acidimicrobiia bacterium]|nr:DUF3107 family protein [Acidimicrobiia bacterium]
MAPRELEIDVEDGEAIATEIETALAEGRTLVWVTDRDGVKHGLAVEKIAFIEMESKNTRQGIGFSTP